MNDEKTVAGQVPIVVEGTGASDSSLPLGGALKWVIDKSGLALAPAIGYFFAFAYESAYCSVFGIPSSQVQVGLTTVLWVVSLVVAFGPTLSNLLVALVWTQQIDQRSHPVARALCMYLAPLLVLLLLFGVSDSRHLHGFWTVLIAIAGFTGIDFLRATESNDIPKRPLIHRLKGPFSFQAEGRFAYPLVTVFGKNAVYLLLGYVAYLTTVVLGQNAAYNEKKFGVPDGHPNFLIVRIYESKALCVEVDRNTKTPTNRYWVSAIDSPEFGAYRYESIGPLNFAK